MEQFNQEKFYCGILSSADSADSTTVSPTSENRTRKMAYLPLNIFFAMLFMLSVWWGWEGEEMRQLFAMISSIFMLPLWLNPLFSIVETGGVISIRSNSGWFSTFILVYIIYRYLILMSL